MNIRDWLAYAYLVGTQTSVWMTLRLATFGLNEALVKATTDPYQVFCTNLIGYATQAYLWARFKGWNLAKNLLAQARKPKAKKDDDGNAI